MIKPACSPHQIVERHVYVVNFFLKVPHGMTTEDVMGHGSTYWANAWKRFEGREWSTVDFVAEDGSWEAHARIMKAADGKVSFRILHEWHEEPSDIEVPDGYRVEFIQEAGWRALDNTGAVLVDRRSQKVEALTAALDHATLYAPRDNDTRRKKAAA